jgi:hypothetical protein
MPRVYIDMEGERQAGFISCAKCGCVHNLVMRDKEFYCRSLIEDGVCQAIRANRVREVKKK